MWLMVVARGVGALGCREGRGVGVASHFATTALRWRYSDHLIMRALFGAGSTRRAAADLWFSQKAGRTRLPSPLIKPDVRISRIRLSDWLHRKAHGGGPKWTRRRWSRGTRGPRAPLDDADDQAMPAAAAWVPAPVSRRDLAPMGRSHPMRSRRRSAADRRLANRDAALPWPGPSAVAGRRRFEPGERFSGNATR
jgi:hypothetical protein